MERKSPISSIHLCNGMGIDQTELKPGPSELLIRCSVKLPTELFDSGDRTDLTISNTPPPHPKWSLIFVINISSFFQAGFRGWSGIKSKWDRRNNDTQGQGSNSGLDHYYFSHPITYVPVNACMSLINVVKDTRPWT